MEIQKMKLEVEGKAIANFKANKLNVDERKRSFYVARMKKAKSNLDLMKVKGKDGKEKEFDPTSFGAYVSKMNPTEIGKSAEFKAYQSASHAWTDSLMRYESGAAIPEAELARYKVTYWPQYKDSDANVKAKAEMRDVLTEALGMGLTPYIPEGVKGVSDFNMFVDPSGKPFSKSEVRAIVAEEKRNPSSSKVGFDKNTGNLTTPTGSTISFN
jgi:hypothetical protein